MEERKIAGYVVLGRERRKAPQWDAERERLAKASIGWIKNVNASIYRCFDESCLI